MHSDKPGVLHTYLHQRGLLRENVRNVLDGKNAEKHVSAAASTLSACTDPVANGAANNFEDPSELPCNGSGGNASVSESKTCSTASNTSTSDSSKENLTTATTSRRPKTTSVANVVKPARFSAKRWPKRSVKSSLKARSQPITTMPLPGDKLPVEIIFAQSFVDVTWQVGLSAGNFCCS